MKRMLRELWQMKTWSLLAIACVVGGALTDLLMPDLLSQIINFGVMAQDLPYIWKTGGAMLAVAALNAGCMVSSSFFSSRISTRLAYRLRSQLFEKVQSFSLGEIDRFGTASLITRSTNDVTQVQMFVVMMFRMVIMAPMLWAGGIFMAYAKSPQLCSVLLVALPLMAALVFTITGLATPLSRLAQQKVDQVNLVMREKLTGVRVIRAFGNEQYELSRFDQANRQLRDTTLRMQRLMWSMMPGMMLLLNFTQVAIVWMGGLQASYSGLLVGDIMAVVQYVAQILRSTMMISMIFVNYPRAAASAARIDEVLRCESAIPDQPGQPAPAPVPGQEGVLTFSHVTFSYPGAQLPAVQDLTFTARPGQVTAIIGSTGAGKTTLLNLIPRFYDPQEGSVTLGGVDLRDYPPHLLRQKIGYVPQRALLFSGDVASNLRFGREDATESDMQQAISIAQAADFVGRQPGALQSEIHQGGANLSGGQRQRMAIARAVVRQPEIYLFDDSFSALDFKTDARLRAALAGQFGHATTLIVAQRVSTILQADQILVLDEGRLVGQGTHRQLLQNCSVYREIAASQLSEEELGADFAPGIPAQEGGASV